ncbi:hypothetical protein NHQ30_003860 [Ciborinia camelliae]|nr:hypothetical protein NHQ30_003860 [Ciborinia camelliae]
MKFFQSIMAMIVSLAVASMAVTVESQNSTALLAAASAAYPRCALICTAQILPSSGCSPTDVECICTNKALQSNVTLCAQKTCTIPELLTTKNVTETLCSAPVRDRTLTAELVGLIGGGLALGFYFLRCLTTALSFRTWESEDWALLVTVLLMIPTIPISVICKSLMAIRGFITEGGYANGMISGESWPRQRYMDIATSEHNRYSQVLYNAAIATIKISFCLLYIRLFPVKPYLYWVYGTLALCVGYGISFTLGTNARNSVTAVSITRLANIGEFADTSNITWDYVPVGYFSLMELYVGIIIACIPALRPLAHKTISKLNSFTSSFRKSGSNGSKSQFKSPWSSGDDKPSSPKRVIRDRDESILKETVVDVEKSHV